VIIEPDTTSASALLDRIERFYDAVPRAAARVEDHGPLSLFVREGAGWAYYARPALGHEGTVTAEDVALVRARQRELGVPEAFEWVHENTPALHDAAVAAGLTVNSHPLLVLDPSAEPVRPAPEGVEVRVLGSDDPLLAAAVAVPHLAFAEIGTHVGTAGPAELAARLPAVVEDGSVARVAARIDAGLSVVAVSLAADSTVTCSGMHQQVGDVSEVVAVGTLPSARRQGLACLVTARLAADARARGAELVFLSATDDAVARVYEKAGFRRLATAMIAEAPAG